MFERRKAAGRLGAGLGYGCEDHVSGSDAVAHYWESKADKCEGGAANGLLCDVGMPVLQRGMHIIVVCCAVILSSFDSS